MEDYRLLHQRWSGLDSELKKVNYTKEIQNFYHKKGKEIYCWQHHYQPILYNKDGKKNASLRSSSPPQPTNRKR